MSVLVLVGGLRRWLSGAVLSAPPISGVWLRVGFAASLAAYLALKLVGTVVQLPNAADLVLLPAGLCALGLALSSRERAAEREDEDIRKALFACALLAVFTATYVTLNTVPTTSSQDESAIVHGAHQLVTEGSLRVTNPLNERYDTNIIGSLDVTYRTPTAMYHRVFPGTALSYAPFSALPGNSGYYLYAALFGTAAIVAVYLLAWRLLGSWWGAVLAALALVASPAFGHWSTTVFNNVPVLSMEMCALALVLWSKPPRRWQLALAGGLMTIVVLMRVTEFIFLPPMLALVWWRCRSVASCWPFAITAALCVPLVLLSNAIFFQNPFFFAHVGSGYLPLQPTPGTGSGQGLVERYFLYVIGVSGSSSNFHFSDKVDNLSFHIRYLGSSTFAFPFLALAFLGVFWWLAARRRNAWLLASAIAVSVLAILFLYGHQHDNYYGYGLPIARSSFVRYSLPIYALLGIGVGAFFLEAERALALARSAGRFALVGAVAIVGTVGILQSYDAHVYGFNRLNYSREHDRAAWEAVDSTLRDQDVQALLIVGSNSMKLVDAKEHPDTINYGVVPGQAWDSVLFPVVDRALHERRVYLLVSAIQPESLAARVAFDQHYFSVVVLRSTNWALYEIQTPIYEASP